MPSYDFALATAADGPEVLALYKSNLGTPGCTWSEDYPDEESIAEDLDRRALYVLRQGGSIIAAASMGTFDELGHLPWGLENPCELARLGVLPRLHRQGIGTLMLRHIFKAAKAMGFGGICILVSHGNPAALDMYLKNGFTICGETNMYDIDFYCCRLDINAAQ